MRDLGVLWQTYQMQPLLKRTWQYELRCILNDNTVLNNDKIYASFKKDFKIFSEGFTIGMCAASYFEVTLSKPIEVPHNSKIVLQVRINGESGSTQWVSFGTFFVDCREETDNTLLLKCYDRMLLGDMNYWEAYAAYTGDTSAPMLLPMHNLETILQVALSALGCQLDTRSSELLHFVHSSAMSTRFPKDASVREVLGYLGSMHGGNWIITDEDKLRLLVLSSDAASASADTRDDFLVMQMYEDQPFLLSIGRDQLIGDMDTDIAHFVGKPWRTSSLDMAAKASQFAVTDILQIQKTVVVYADTKEVTPVEGDPNTSIVNYYESGAQGPSITLEFSNPIATPQNSGQEICDYVHNTIHPFNYRGFVANNVIMDPGVEVGDIIYLEGAYINVINMSWYGLMASDLEAPLQGNVQSEFPYVPKEVKTFDRVINKIEGVRVQLEVTEESILAQVSNEIEGLDARLELTAEGLEAQITDVSDDMDQKFLEMNITAAGLQLAITQEIGNRETSDQTLQNNINITAAGLTAEITNRQEADIVLQNNITVTAQGLQANITAEGTARFNRDNQLQNDINYIDGQVDNAFTQIDVQAGRIESVVGQNIAGYFTASSLPSSPADWQKSCLCKVGSNFYYWNNIYNGWKLYPYGGIKSAFLQTSAGFELTGDVAIDGSLVVSGTINSDRLNVDTLSASRLYSRGSAGSGSYAKINSSIGEFGIYNSLAPADAYPNNQHCIFGVYNSLPNINFYTYGNNFLGYDNNNKVTWPKGTWNFGGSGVTVLGLDAIAKFG